MLDTVVISGENICSGMVFGTLVGVSVLSIIWSELLIPSAISCRGLETDGSLVRGFLEPESWPCVGAQAKGGSHVVIWAACRRMLNQYETSCVFRPHPTECLYARCSIFSLSIGPDYQYQRVGVRSHLR